MLAWGGLCTEHKRHWNVLGHRSEDYTASMGITLSRAAGQTGIYIMVSELLRMHSIVESSEQASRDIPALPISCHDGGQVGF